MRSQWNGKTTDKLYASILEKIRKVKVAKMEGKLDDILKPKESMSTKDKAQHERVMHSKSVTPNERGHNSTARSWG